jgi:hypothetical protein
MKIPENKENSQKKVRENKEDSQKTSTALSSNDIETLRSNVNQLLCKTAEQVVDMHEIKASQQKLQEK